MSGTKLENRKPKTENRMKNRFSIFGFRSALLALFALFVGCAGAPGSSGGGAGGADLLAGIERRVLPNGLAIVVREDHRLPTLTAMLAYRVGSVNEPEGLTGVSHFFEHMVFKGSAKYKRG